MSCAHDQLEWAGLRDEVVLHDGPTTAAQIEWPVGFVYLDDGKSRFWNAPVLAYLRDKLMERLIRDGRMELASACFEFLPTRAKLDLLGWEETDIFAHS